MSPDGDPPGGQRAARSGWAAAALVAALVTPGGGWAADSVSVRSLQEIREAQLVRQHWDLSCGAAAIATVFTYQLGVPVSERDAALGMLRAGNPALVRARLGFSLLDLKRLADAYGLEADGLGGMTLDDLVAAAPAIVPITVFGFGHFVVMRGRVGDRVLVADPAFGNRTLTARAFEAAWPSRVAFVVHRPGEPNPPNRMAPAPELVAAPGGEVIRQAEAGLRSLGAR